MGPLLCQGLCQEELERKRPLNFSLNLASERHFTPDQYNSIQTTILSISIFQRFKDAKPNNFFNFLKTAKSLVKISPPTVLLTYILYVITTSQDCETIFILYTKYQLVTEPTSPSPCDASLPCTSPSVHRALTRYFVALWHSDHEGHAETRPVGGNHDMWPALDPACE